MGACARWRALGTSVVVIATQPHELTDAAATVREVLDQVDLACSRFRDDSELCAVNAAGGSRVTVSRLFLRATRCALRAARLTDGDIDPTIGSSLRAAGYDRDFAKLRAGGPVRFRRAGGWQRIELDDAHSTVRVPAGIELDYGATAKALAADVAAADAADGLTGGVLVSLGGDIATAGPPPPEGWAVRVTDDHSSASADEGQTIALRSGGLATSSTTVRRWRRGEFELHHILDPHTGAPVEGSWRTVSVAAACCVDANIASTAAIVRGAQAPEWLEGLGLPARLVALDGTVTLAAGWPEPELEPR
ncbi:MAG: FAD:protein FMN transferase [Solirubrobacteraceae bacterium]|jgi:thiamine biosynthesis lipoprotein